MEFGVGGPKKSVGVLFDQVDDLVGDDEGEEPVSHRAVENGLEEDVAAGEAESCQAVPGCRPRFGLVLLHACRVAPNLECSQGFGYVRGAEDKCAIVGELGDFMAIGLISGLKTIP